MEQFFLNVLSMSMTASLVIVAVIAIRLFLHKAPNIFSYALWAVVLFRLLCPISFESVIGILPQEAPALEAYQVDRINESIANIRQNIDAPIIFTEPDIEVIENKVDYIQIGISIGTVIWLLGIVFFIGYSVVQYEKVKKNLVGAVILKESIYLADYIPSPFVFGIVKPKIYLPSSLSEEQREYVIAHEMVHIKRLDYLTRIIAFFALAIYWFHPLVWIAYWLSDKDMELSCDEAVMKDLNQDARVEYASTLITIATGKRIRFATPLAFGEGNPKDRIKNIINYKKPVVWISVVTCVILCILGIALMSNQQDNQDVSISENIDTATGNKNGTEEIKIAKDKLPVDSDIVNETIVSMVSEMEDEEEIVVAANAQVENKSYLEQYDCVKLTVNKQQIDITHDGIDDYLETYFYVFRTDLEEIDLKNLDIDSLFVKGGNLCYVAIYDGKDTKGRDTVGTLLWEKSFSGSHAGNGQVSVVVDDKEAYLFLSNLYRGQRDHDFSYQKFSLDETGNQIISAQNAIQVELGDFVGDEYVLPDEAKRQILDFQNELEEQLKQAKAIVMTDVALESQIVSTMEKEYTSLPFYEGIIQYYLGETQDIQMIYETEIALKGSESRIKLVTNTAYEYDEETLAAGSCQVYDITGGEEVQVGKLQSMGTAYPIAYDDTGIYESGPREIYRYEMMPDKEKMTLVEWAKEKYDEDGEASYTYFNIALGEVEDENAYQELRGKYQKATVVNFMANDGGNY